jgi:curved DNA-binding protein CbpA
MTGRESQDPYIVLGVARQASGEEIGRAYRRAARASHPDGGGAGSSAQRFQAVSDAYEVLRDPVRRAVYDRSHPLAPSRMDAREGSVRYAAPGSQHLVLGRQASVRQGGDIEELFRLAFSLLRADW